MKSTDSDSTGRMARQEASEAHAPKPAKSKASSAKTKMRRTTQAHQREKELYILRHAIAVDRGAHGYANDSQRPLTPEGKKKMRRAAKGMKALGLEFESIISSPYLRCKATAEIVARTLGASSRLRLSDHLTPDGDPRALLAHLANHDSQDLILLVGHEPYLSKLVGRLIANTGSLSLKFKKGGLCKLTAGHLKFGHCAELEWLLTPQQLAQFT